MKRRKTKQVKLGKVKIGTGAPISIQSMAKTDTNNIAATIKQIKTLESLGCEVIRIAIKDRQAAFSISKIKKKISIPIEADIHFDYKLALLAIEKGADGIRLNPGNISKPNQIKEIIRLAKLRKISIRIGVNSGSLPVISGSQADGMVKTVSSYLKIFEKMKFRDIMISLKASDVATTIDAYRKMAKICNYPFHLGVTATGSGSEAIVKSAIGIGALLTEGIGDTIRVSLTGPPEDEIVVAKDILQALGLRHFGINIISCPTCGRCRVDLAKIFKSVKKRLQDKNYMTKGKPLMIAIMGCEVNGPGEAKEADIGIAFGGGTGILFKKGKVIKKVKAKDAAEEIVRTIK